MGRTVVLDFETYPVNGKSFVMEIGCVEVIDGNIGASFHTLIRPTEPVSPFVLKLTGISNDELEQAPLFPDVIESFYRFIGNAYIVAHNAPLDRLSYESICQYYGFLPATFVWIDSQDVIKILNPKSSSLQLQSLLSIHGLLSEVSHRALDDALGLARLLLKFRQETCAQFNSYEVSLLKNSNKKSIVNLIKFLLRFFVLIKPTLENESFIHYDFDHFSNENQVQSSLAHLNFSFSQFQDYLTTIDEKTLVICTDHEFKAYPYIYESDDYVYPVKIKPFYPILMSDACSHVEVIETLGIINWLRQTKTFYKHELNENLRVRLNQLSNDMFDNVPIEKVNFLCQRIEFSFQHQQIVQCNYDTFAYIVHHLPKFLNFYQVLFYNFSSLNVKLHSLFIDRFSTRTLKPLTNVVVCLSSLINNLMKHDQRDDRLIQDVARIRYFVDLIREESSHLFVQLDNLMAVLSVNIYDHRRQVLINQNVIETLEWQDVIGHLNLVSHYLQELIRIFERIGFYIVDEFSDWIRDLIIQIKMQKKVIGEILTSDSKRVIYIEAPVKHAATNCAIYVSPTYYHDFFRMVYESSPGMLIHQPMNQRLDPSYMDRLIGFPIKKDLESNLSTEHIQFTSSPIQDFKSLLKSSLDAYHVYLFFNHKQQLRVWKKKLNQLIRRSGRGSVNSIEFFTLDRIKTIAFDENALIIFQDFKLPNVLQPIHQQRLHCFEGDEHAYTRQLFSEYLDVCLSRAFCFEKIPVIFNFDSEFPAYISSQL
ncbi:MAG: 3'-5' exonuclease [Candidatus Margulisiibacteriota bacterium]